ncbi:MAG: translocation/assembly module TamB domain-containing protein [Herminiimonas sp.]|nr:translocation/assembly module TamB domain-containing protein [Herminiimonas sp.]
MPRWFKRVAAVLGVLVIIVTAIGLIGVQTQFGARTAWRVMTALLPGTLSGDLDGGTLRNGLTVRNVVYRSAGAVVRIDTMQADWKLFQAPLTLDAASIHIGTADVTLLPTPPKPRVLPADIRLPLGLDLHSVRIDKVLVHQDAVTVALSDIRLKVHSDRMQHALSLEKIVTPLGTVAATVQLEGTRPFALSGTASLAGLAAANPYRVAARLSGSLEQLGIAVEATDARLNGTAVIEAAPFAAVQLRRAQVQVHHLDPQVFNAGLPHADLDIVAALQPTNTTAIDLARLTVAGPVTITNALPGAIDRGLLPLVSAKADVLLDAQHQQLAAVRILLPGAASLDGTGALHGDSGSFDLQARNLNLQALHSALRPSALAGPLTVRLAGATQQVTLKLADSFLSATAAVELGPKLITLQSATLRAGPAELALKATLTRDAQAAYTAAGKLSDFNPALFMATLPKARSGSAAAPSRINARINTTFDARGVLHPVLSADVNFKIYDSMYDGLPMTGGGTLHLVDKRLLPSQAQLSVAGNDLAIKGSFGAPADRLNVDLNALALQRLGFGLSGLARLQGQVGGTINRPVVDATYRAEKLTFGTHRVDFLSGLAKTQGVPGTTPDAKVVLSLDAKGVHSGDIDLSSLKAVIDGTYASHTLRIDAGGRLRGKPLAVTIAAQGQLQEKPQGMMWSGMLRTLDNNGLPRVHLAAPMAVTVAPGTLVLGAARLAIGPAAIDLKSLRYGSGSGSGSIASEGSVNALAVAEVLALREQFTGAAPPVNTNLVLDGNWKFSLGDKASGFARIVRRSGDVRVGDTALGLTEMALRADLQAAEMRLDAQIAGSRFGTVNGQGRIGLQRTDGLLRVTAQSPVSGHVVAALPRLQSLAVLAGPGVALAGSASANITIGGFLAEPKLAGTVNGDALSLTLYDQGVRLHDGIARLTLDNNVVSLRQLEVQGGDGTLRATGRIALDRANQGLRATVVADHLQLLASPSGQLTVSGQAKAENVDAKLLVSGKFMVDQAQFSLPEKTAPQLDDDVLVIRGGKAPPVVARDSSGAQAKQAGAFTPEVNVELDLGNRFYFRGSGADLRLVGVLKVQSSPRTAPQAYGTIRVAEGSYEAFGTKLAIEQGVINFQGPLRNPNINILAMRRQADVASGVQVSGDVQRPRVQLVSEPELPQEEKLSWLVFGHGSSSGSGAGGVGQAQTAVKSAAFGLVNKFGGKNVAKTFGLDQLAIGSSEYGLNNTQVVNLGKKISEKFSIGYEQSLASAGSVLKLTYDLSQYWSLVVRGGSVTGLDVLYNKRFDSLGKK